MSNRNKEKESKSVCIHKNKNMKEYKKMRVDMDFPQWQYPYIPSAILCQPQAIKSTNAITYRLRLA